MQISEVTYFCVYLSELFHKDFSLVRVNCSYCLVILTNGCQSTVLANTFPPISLISPCLVLYKFPQFPPLYCFKHYCIFAVLTSIASRSIRTETGKAASMQFVMWHTRRIQNTDVQKKLIMSNSHRITKIVCVQGVIVKCCVNIVYAWHKQIGNSGCK